MTPFGSENKKHFNLKDAKTFRKNFFTRKRLFETTDMHFNIYCIAPGQFNSLHRHPLSDEILYFIEGSGECIVGERYHCSRVWRFGLCPQRCPALHSQYP